jgi:hypothetical protein
MAERRPAVRERIAQALESLDPEIINTFIQDALSATKTAWGTCDGCRKKFPVEVPDWNARERVLEICAKQGLGRPGSAEEETSQGLVLRRSLVFPDADYEHILALIEEHGAGSLHPHPDGGVEVVTHSETNTTEPDGAA